MPEMMWRQWAIYYIHERPAWTGGMYFVMVCAHEDVRVVQFPLDLDLEAVGATWHGC